MPSDASAPPLDMRPPQLIGADQQPAMDRLRRCRVRLRRASWAFTTRRVPTGTACMLLPPKGKPQVGDLVLARIDALGQHAALQLVNGRRRQLFAGDEIVVSFGNRYASNQFEAVVPESMGPCHLVAGGGIAARARSWHERISRGPTHITPIGLLADGNGRRLNLADFALAPVRSPVPWQPTPIVVVGTAMDAGKTQTCVHLCRGLIAAGLRVGYAKVTGTGAGGDIWWLRDAGADPVLDFTDVGLPSTYLSGQQQLETAMRELIAQVASHGVDAMVIEIADGVLQQETAGLLRSDLFQQQIGGVVLAAQDSMGATAGCQSLRKLAPPVLCLSGVLAAGPLQVAEASNATGLAVYNREQLATPEIAIGLLGTAQAHLKNLPSRNDGARTAP